MITELCRFIWQFALSSHTETYLISRSAGLAGAISELLVAVDFDVSMQVPDENSIFSFRSLYNAASLALLVLSCHSPSNPSLAVRCGVIDSLAFRIDSSLIESMAAWVSLNESEKEENLLEEDDGTGVGVPTAFADACFPFGLLRFLSKNADVQRLLAASTKMQQTIKSIFRREKFILYFVCSID